MAESDDSTAKKNWKNAEWKKTLDFKAKTLAYGTHFHCMSHHLSADKYEKRDRWFTYALTFSTALGSAGVGSMITSLVSKSNDPRVKGTAAGLLLVSTLTTAFVTHLNSTNHSPAKKQDLHNKAAYRKEKLSHKVLAWSDAVLNPETDADDKDMLNTYEEFLDEQLKIQEECVSSEDDTFKAVHKQLSPKWKELGQKLGKFFPEDKTE